MSIYTRFEQKYIKGAAQECWEWIAYKIPNGYGRFNKRLGIREYKYMYAHRMAYELYVGPIPDGMCVLHRCDNPGCVNPEHLWLGTQLENVIDRDKKNRHVPRGPNKVYKP